MAANRGDLTDLIPVAWVLAGVNPGRSPRIEACFHPVDIRYAVRRYGFCLSRSLTWDDEPLPTNRSQTWIDRHRWETLDKAARAARKVVARENEVTGAELTRSQTGVQSHEQS